MEAHLAGEKKNIKTAHEVVSSVVSKTTFTAIKSMIEFDLDFNIAVHTKSQNTHFLVPSGR